MVELFQNIRPWFTEFLNSRNFRKNAKIERLFVNLIYFQDNYILIGFLALILYCLITIELLFFVFLIVFMASVKLTQITVRRRLPGSTWLAILLLVIDAAAAFYWLPVVFLFIVVVIVLHAYFYFNKNHFINARSRIKISGLRRNIPYDDLRENLIRQNNLQFNEDIRVLSIHETQRRIYFDAILEVSLQLKRKLLNMDRVKIGSDLCYVNDIEKSFWDKLTNVAIGMVLLVFIYIKLGSNSEITQEFVNGPSEDI